MIQMIDLLNHKYEFADLDLSVSDQLMDILARLQWVQDQPGCPIKDWVCTSGLRTMADHLRIYKNLAAQHKKPFLDGIYDESKVPKGSKHLYGRAADIYDPALLLTQWLRDNPHILEQAGLWCEEGNANWVHFQNKPHASWKPGEDHWFQP